MGRLKPESRQGLALAVAYCCACLVWALDPAATHDEGLLMYGFARSLSDAFAPCFFLQKVKPALALFYAPVARLGLAPYITLHVVVAAAALYWTHAIARSLQHKRPWIPAVVLGLSPLYTWSAITGVSNSDGVAFMALAVYLLQVRRNFFAAGVALGMLPWVRYEHALSVLALAPWVLLRHRSIKFVVGMAIWPLTYLAAGALYHADFLWFLRFLPGPSELEPVHDAWAIEFATHNRGIAALSLALVSPAVFFLVMARPARASSIERALGVFAVAFLGFFLVTYVSPRDLGPAMFLGLSARYAIVPLLGVALVLGRVVESLETETDPRSRDTITAAAYLAVGWVLRTQTVVPLFASVAAGTVTAAARAHARRLTVTLLLGFFVIVPVFLRDEMLALFPLRDRSLASLAAWLATNPTKGEVYTNHQLLVPYLVRTDNPLASRTKFMLAADHRYELVHLSNPANGQRAVVLDVVPRAVFGNVVHPEELDPDRVRPGTFFVLTNDTRTQQILPTDRWKSRLKSIADTDGIHVYELLP